MTVKVAHLIYSLDVGGLERFMVDMVNRFPPEYEHVVISLTGATEFKDQLNSDIDVHCLGKKTGQDLGVHFKLAKLLRKLNVDILHSYNLATIEYHLVSRLVGVKGHLHAEHGREITDPQGLNWKHNLLRRLMSPFVGEFVAVSKDLADWLATTVKIAPRKISMIPNGVDLTRYAVNNKHSAETVNSIRFVHVARLQAVKNQMLLLNAFDQCYNQIEREGIETKPELTIVGDGGMREELEAYKATLDSANAITFAGMQADVIPFYQNSDVFVLSSVAEGTPMTVLEAMASGLPVIATAVGGLPDIISDKEGKLVASEDIDAMANALYEAVLSPAEYSNKGVMARKRMEDEFDQIKSDREYQALYQKVLA